MCDPGDILPFVPSIPIVPGLPSIPIGPTYPIWGPFILPHPKPDFSHVDKKDDIEKPQTRLKELEGNGYKKDPANVIVEDFSGETFESVYNKMKDALKPYSALHDTGAWGDVRNAIVEAVQNFKIALGVLEQSGEAWKGKTHDAALQNLETSYPEPITAADGAGVQGILEDAFIRTIAATQNNIVDNKSRYDEALQNFPEQDGNIKKAYNDFAYNVLTDVYRPGIVEIGKNNPAFTAGVKLDVGPNGPGPTGPGPFGPGGTGPGPIGGGGLPSRPGTPNPPKFDPPNPPKTPKTPETPDFPKTPTGTPTLPQSLGQVPDTGSPAAPGGAPSPTGVPSQPPEGVLGLGPKGLGGAPKGAGAKGTGAGGKAGGGAGAKLPRGLAPGKATATPAAAFRTPAAGGAAAGLGGMGTPGAGAPAAGAGGRDGNKAYQVSKALRRKKTGEQIAGEAEAVVPVVGAPEKPVKPQANQPDQTPRPDPSDDAAGVRTVSRAPQTTEPATRMPGQ
jgi:hypothetical protein